MLQFLRKHTLAIVVGIVVAVMAAGVPALAHRGGPDHALFAHNAGHLDGFDSMHFLPRFGKAADANLLDGRNSTAFLLDSEKAADSNLLDGLDSTAFLQGSRTDAGSFSCTGSSFVAPSGGTAYSTVDHLLESSAGGLFRCNAVLPDDATVTAFRMTAEDTDASNVTCNLLKSDLVPSLGGDVIMASATTSGTPGNTQVSDTSVGSATIDNNGNAYYVECLLPASVADGIYGAVVEYTTTVSNGN
jgi:hypothetical protein